MMMIFLPQHAIQWSPPRDPSVVIELSERNDLSIVGLLQSSKHAVYIYVRSLSDPLILGEINRERERGVTVVVSLIESHGLPKGHPRTIIPGEMIIDASWKWYGPSNWNLASYRASSDLIQVGREEREFWSHYFRRMASFR